jgi:alkyl sulfatase BDS1-like metallo-beta-lactamase superfamily hydrolase
MAGKLPWGKVYSKVAYPTRSIQPSSELLELLRARYRAEDALKLTMTIGITVNEKSGNNEHSIELRKGILLYKQDTPAVADARITIERKLLVALSIGAISWSDALSQNKIKIDSGQSSVERFVKLIDTLD